MRCHFGSNHLRRAGVDDKFLHPGPGYGGSCRPEDVSALIRTGREHRAPLSIIEQVERVDHERKIAMTCRIEQTLGGSARGKTIAILSVTFKPNTDEMRDAPSLAIVPMLTAPPCACTTRRAAGRPSR